nr:uncharacterized protein LOC109163447 isoform X1 [Ipomoea batatas]GMD10866.1 uncharacterized protein LOC109163447 isoform X1 [Ipomoea batatas]GME14568.1 uncharacterized protein LOC109163447 isoform X1 [Ipomoea batatas]
MSLSKKNMDAAEESGWTDYLQDFSHINKNPSSSPCPYSSLVGSQALNRLNFKKAVIRPNTKLSDPDLEDTASSPVNSPKVSSLKQMENNYRRQEINSGNYMGKGADFEDYSEMQGEGRRSINFAAKSEEDNIDLMKLGRRERPLHVQMHWAGEDWWLESRLV